MEQSKPIARPRPQGVETLVEPDRRCNGAAVKQSLCRRTPRSRPLRALIFVKPVKFVPGRALEAAQNVRGHRLRMRAQEPP